MKNILTETDKQLHILACYAITLIIAMAFRRYGYEVLDSSLLGWMVAFVVGASKEIYDEKKYKGADVRDWIADIIGYTSGAFTAWVLLT